MSEGELKRQIREKIYRDYGNVGEPQLNAILDEVKQDFPFVISEEKINDYSQQLSSMDEDIASLFWWFIKWFGQEEVEK